MTAPTIHLNGTNRDELREQAIAAYQSLEWALRAMTEARPNGRDYYPQGAGAIERAMDEHEARIVAVRTVRDEYEALALALDE